jgi:hypothetical protein
LRSCRQRLTANSGMPNLELSEDQINELIAYLLERK